jgi:SAM-dependent methyltransferase
MANRHEIEESSFRLHAEHTLKPIVSLGMQPLANNLVPPDQTREPDELFPLDLMWCEDLKLVQLSVSVAPRRLFSTYLYLTSFSQALVDAARENVETQVAEYGLQAGDLAMEIGSNDGYLLQHYQARGLNVLGVDPAENVAAHARDKGVPTLCAFFGADVAEALRNEGRRPKIVHANNVMAHIPDVAGVIRGLSILLDDRGVFVVETPYVRRMVEQCEFDTIYHEHLFYYSLTSFNMILEREGLTVIDVDEIGAHGGSLRITAARPGVYERSRAASTMLADERSVGLDRYEYYEAFGKRVPELIKQLRSMVDDLVAGGRTIAGYGAAAKATVILNTLGESASALRWVADRSSFKQGRLIPGVRVPVVPVETIFSERPDYLLVFAWNYIDEIARQLSSYRQAGGQLIVPFPEPRVVG